MSEVISVNAAQAKGDGAADANSSRLVNVLDSRRGMYGAVDDLEPVLDDAAGRGVSTRFCLTRFCLRESDKTE